MKYELTKSKLKTNLLLRSVVEHSMLQKKREDLLAERRKDVIGS